MIFRKFLKITRFDIATKGWFVFSENKFSENFLKIAFEFDSQQRIMGIRCWFYKNFQETF